MTASPQPIRLKTAQNAVEKEYAALVEALTAYQRHVDTHNTAYLNTVSPTAGKHSGTPPIRPEAQHESMQAWHGKLDSRLSECRYAIYAKLARTQGEHTASDLTRQLMIQAIENAPHPAPATSWRARLQELPNTTQHVIKQGLLPDLNEMLAGLKSGKQQQ